MYDESPSLELSTELAAEARRLEERLFERLAHLDDRMASVERLLETAGSLRVGDLVRIDGLDNIAHLRLNGKKAQLRQWEGPGGRWVAQVQQTRELKSLKVDNLTQLCRSSPSASSDHCASVGRSDGGGGLSVGDIVKILGLRRQREMNGVRAEICGWDDEGGRWLVRLVHNGQQRRLRTVNLRRVGEAVRVGLESLGGASSSTIREEVVAGIETGVIVQLRNLKAESLNGKRARVQRQDAQAGRWVVQLLHTFEEKSLKSENLEEVRSSSPRTGQLAEISGLEQAAHLNGLRAEILAWDADRGRWNVRIVETGEEKSLRPKSLSLASGGELRAGGRAVIECSELEMSISDLVDVIRWDGATSSWIVVPSGGGEERPLRPRNLRAIPLCGAASGTEQPPAGVCGKQSGRCGMEDAVEILGDSSDEFSDCEEEDAADAVQPAGMPTADAPCAGTVVVIEGLGGRLDGRRARLLKWEDVGGVFGQWSAQLLPISVGAGSDSEAGEIVSLPPSCFDTMTAACA